MRTTTPETDAWLVRWILLGRPLNLPPDMLLTIPRTAFARQNLPYCTCDVGPWRYAIRYHTRHAHRNRAFNLTAWRPALPANEDNLYRAGSLAQLLLILRQHAAKQGLELPLCETK